MSWGPLVKAALRGHIGDIYRLTQKEEVRTSGLYSLATSALSEKRTRAHVARVVYLPPLHLLWSLGARGETPAARLHQAYCRGLWNDRSHLERAGLCLMLLAWPAVVALAMVWATANNGSVIARRTGKPVTTQLREQWAVAFREGIMPPWYYIFDFHDDAKRARANEYLCRYETKGGLYRLVKSTRVEKQVAPLQDKAAFSRRCREHRLPTIREYLHVESGELHWQLQPERLPDTDLFLKPVRGRGGTGAAVWYARGPARYQSPQGEVISDTELINRLQATRLGYLVQRRVVGHASIVDLSLGALPTVRMLTILDEEGEPEATHAVFRMPLGKDIVVDNFHAGGIAASVDMQTGILGSATDIGLRPDCGWCDFHPATWTRIRGRSLPFWAEVVSVAKAAHRAFAGRVFIGWDIAITDDGPVLIEGNAAPDVDLIQRPHEAPLGNSRFGVLLDFHLERANTATRRAASFPGDT